MGTGEPARKTAMARQDNALCLHNPILMWAPFTHLGGEAKYCRPQSRQVETPRNPRHGGLSKHNCVSTTREPNPK